MGCCREREGELTGEERILTGIIWPLVLKAPFCLVISVEESSSLKRKRHSNKNNSVSPSNNGGAM